MDYCQDTERQKECESFIALRAATNRVVHDFVCRTVWDAARGFTVYLVKGGPFCTATRPQVPMSKYLEENHVITVIEVLNLLCFGSFEKPGVKIEPISPANGDDLISSELFSGMCQLVGDRTTETWTSFVRHP